VVAKEVLRTFCTTAYAKREAFLYVKGDKSKYKKSNNIDGDKSKLVIGSEQEQEQYQVRDGDEKGRLYWWKKKS